MARRKSCRGQRLLTEFTDWLVRHTQRAPAALRARVMEYAAAAEQDDLAVSLAAAGQHALDRVVAHPGDRSVALDLLAADALITLALLARAQQRPERLDEFAAGLVR